VLRDTGGSLGGRAEVLTSEGKKGRKGRGGAVGAEICWGKVKPPSQSREGKVRVGQKMGGPKRSLV